ncbi:unnamed protein product, partial [Symbiodinium sp. CCMP2456]
MKEPADSDFLITGVKAAKEFHTSHAASTGGFLTSTPSGFACPALRLMRSYDQFDASAFATREHLATATFTEWVSTRHKEPASLWKHERLYQEKPRHLRGKGRETDGGDDSDSEEQGKGDKEKKKKEQGLCREGIKAPRRERVPVARSEAPRWARPKGRTPRDHHDYFVFCKRIHSGTDCSPSGIVGEAILSPFERLQRRVDASARTLKHIAAVQQWIMDDLHRRVALYGKCPEEISEDTVLGDLGRRYDLYNQEAKHLVGIDLTKIKPYQKQHRQK